MTTDHTCRIWEENDLPHLLSYLSHLDHETRLRFEPHPFTLDTLQRLYNDPVFRGFMLIENRSTYIIGYAIIKLGYFEHDLSRLNNYSFFPAHNNTAMYAPSLAAAWRNKGLGKILWQTTEAYLKQQQIKQVLLWGGVQETNTAAVTYYQKLGFETIGGFEMNGMWNIDMVRYL
ncbi:MAG TPA: hypothetical protein DHW64_05645 [Chitinophagaceae bacterium]|nr:hypothetical protein [Chitinophagaceae bacterium]